MSDAAEIARLLLESADWLREASGLASEHSTEEHVPIPVAPHQARTIVNIMETAAVHIGREMK
jgi:hypothetical protein